LEVELINVAAGSRIDRRYLLKMFRFRRSQFLRWSGHLAGADLIMFARPKSRTGRKLMVRSCWLPIS